MPEDDRTPIKTTKIPDRRKERQALQGQSLFIVALNAGWRRLLSSRTAEGFVLAVNGEIVVTNVWEAVLISEKVHSQLCSTATNCVFCIDDDRVTGAVFARFLVLVRSRTGGVPMSRSDYPQKVANISCSTHFDVSDSSNS
jgi:hypothetical protein